MFETNIMISSIIFGSIGMGYFIFGKNAERYLFMISGIVLMIYPYFVTNIYYMVITGMIFIILPFIVKT